MGLKKLGGAVSLLLVACSSYSEQPDGESIARVDDELIGGQPATESQYPSTLYGPGCTLAKVGPRHFLLAAHCVHDGAANTVSAGYAPGNTFSVTADNGPNMTNYVNLTIASTTIAPAWLQSCAAAHQARPNEVNPCGVNVLNPEHAPDVAVVVVTQDSPTIPAATVDAAPVAVGDPVVMTGYGCEAPVGSYNARFKLQAETAAPASILDHPGTYISTADAPNVAASYVLTPGFAISSSNASLCPGDSGGPLYRGNTSQLLVVGVNAYYTFPPGDAQPAQTNWFTRLDSAARYPVTDWLRSLGVNVTGGPTGSSPCASLCASPTVYTNAGYNSGNLGTGARCFETKANLTGGNCGGFATGRTFSINGSSRTCNGGNFVLPAKRNGGYCFQASAGNNSWAWFGTW